MTKDLRLSILSPERQYLDQLKIQQVTLPSSEGEVVVLADHVPFIGLLKTGVFSYQELGKSPVRGVVSSGFFEFLENHVKVLAETLEMKDEIDLKRAIRAQKQAEQMLARTDLDAYQVKKYELKLYRALVRQDLVK